MKKVNIGQIKTFFGNLTSCFSAYLQFWRQSAYNKKKNCIPKKPGI